MRPRAVPGRPYVRSNPGPIISAFLLTGDRDWAQVRLGPLTEEPAEMDLSRHVLLRCTLEPRWLQHDCFFVDLQEKTKSSAKKK